MGNDRIRIREPQWSKNLWMRVKALIASVDAVATVKQNGTPLTPDANKAVNIVADANVIEGISFNGSTVTPSNKQVSLTETDPTVPSWAKANNKPTYTASEVGAKPVQSPVSSPSSSGNALAFIDTISQNADGVITPTKKAVSYMDGATSQVGGSGGLVPPPAAGDDAKFLRGDGQWATPSGSTVTGVKGGKEGSYRTGNVNLTPDNIGSPELIMLEDADISNNPYTFVLELTQLCEEGKPVVINLPPAAMNHLTEGEYNAYDLKGTMYWRKYEYTEDGDNYRRFTITYDGVYEEGSHLMGELICYANISFGTQTYTHFVGELAKRNELPTIISYVKYNGSVVPTIRDSIGLSYADISDLYRYLSITQYTVSDAAELQTYINNNLPLFRMGGMYADDVVMGYLTGGIVSDYFIGVIFHLTTYDASGATVSVYNYYGALGQQCNNGILYGYSQIRTENGTAQVTGQRYKIYGTYLG